MTNIYFYHNARDRLGAACALLNKALDQERRFTVYVPDQAMAQTLDRLLWTQAALSFIPHCYADSPLAAETPVLIATNPDKLPEGSHLLNLGKTIPPDFSSFSHLIEIVSQDEEDRAHARQRFKSYKQQGYEIKSISLNHDES